MISPYFQEDGITIYNADNRNILPHLPKFDLLLTDPPYGIKQDQGVNPGGFDGFGNRIPRIPRKYEGDWDSQAADEERITLSIKAATYHVIWGGNYLSNILVQKPKWFVWDKENTMPTYSDCELAWTSLPGVSVKMKRYNGSGLMAKEQHRQHPTQKPLALMVWCLQQAGDSIQTVLDPFMGSGTTLVAAKLRGLQATGIELSKPYCDIAIERLSQKILIPV